MLLLPPSSYLKQKSKQRERGKASSLGPPRSPSPSAPPLSPRPRSPIASLQRKEHGLLGALRCELMQRCEGRKRRQPAAKERHQAKESGGGGGRRRWSLSLARSSSPPSLSPPVALGPVSSLRDRPALSLCLGEASSAAKEVHAAERPALCFLIDDCLDRDGDDGSIAPLFLPSFLLPFRSPLSSPLLLHSPTSPNLTKPKPGHRQGLAPDARHPRLQARPQHLRRRVAATGSRRPPRSSSS